MGRESQFGNLCLGAVEFFLIKDSDLICCIRAATWRPNMEAISSSSAGCHVRIVFIVSMETRDNYLLQPMVQLNTNI